MTEHRVFRALFYVAWTMIQCAVIAWLLSGLDALWGVSISLWPALWGAALVNVWVAAYSGQQDRETRHV